jgi:hypothetical protein
VPGTARAPAAREVAGDEPPDEAAADLPDDREGEAEHAHDETHDEPETDRTPVDHVETSAVAPISTRCLWAIIAGYPDGRHRRSERASNAVSPRRSLHTVRTRPLD